ncbi:MAG TPA: hypothetical protein VGA52_01450 [Anaerolineales bacterium]
MSQPQTEQQSGRLTRLVASLVLVPTVPLLLASVAALGLFYTSPERFGALLARLPGDDLIRSVLVFAPATLFAVVVLAILYAVDRPATEVRPVAVERPRPQIRRSLGQIASWALLAIGLPLLVLSVGLWLFSFIAPGRFAALLEPLPGDAYLQLGLRAAPWAMLAVVLPAAGFLLLSRRAQAKAVDRPLDAARPIRWGVALTLLATLPLLALSLTALGVFLFDPGRFQDLLAHLTQEAFLRLALVFTPAVLLSLALLAVLFLFYSRPQAAVVQPGTAEALPIAQRQTLAIWVLTGGLAGSAVVALGLLGVAVYLVAR